MLDGTSRKALKGNTDKTLFLSPLICKVVMMAAELINILDLTGHLRWTLYAEEGRWSCILSLITEYSSSLW